MLPKKDLSHPSESELKLMAKEFKEMRLDRTKITENESNVFVMMKCDNLSSDILNIRKSSGKEKQQAILEVRDTWKALKKSIEEYLVAFDDIKSQCKEDQNDSIQPWVKVREKACERIVQQVEVLKEKLVTLEDEAIKRHTAGISGAIKAKLFKDRAPMSKTGSRTLNAKLTADSLEKELKRGLEVESELLLKAKDPERYEQNIKRQTP